MKAGLFDILVGRFSDGTDITTVRPDSQYVLSIISNLNRLFNSRRGSLAHLPDYGLPDITEIYRDIPDSITKLQTAIAEAVEKYEPRLRRIRVEPQKTDPYAMRLVFILHGQLANRERVRFQTTFSSNEVAQVSSWQRTG